jgi:hypothetical protein
MDFEQIEDLFPDGAFTIESGHTCVTAQWLHDFARNIAEAEREACARICEKVEAARYAWWDARAIPEDQGAAVCAGELAIEIRERSNAGAKRHE